VLLFDPMKSLAEESDRLWFLKKSLSLMGNKGKKISRSWRSGTAILHNLSPFSLLRMGCGELSRTGVVGFRASTQPTLLTLSPSL
jgi:hypothetical protein